MSKTIIVSISVMLISMLMMVSCKRKDEQSRTELKEVSTDIDLAYLKPFLSRIIPFIEDGFSHAEIEQILNGFNKLEKDEEIDIDFKIKYNGTESIMKFKIVKEDVDTVRFYIFTHSNLSKKIDEELIKFTKEKGLW